jgi:hypothetical protein
VQANFSSRHSEEDQHKKQGGLNGSIINIGLQGTRLGKGDRMGKNRVVSTKARSLQVGACSSCLLKA